MERQSGYKPANPVARYVELDQSIKKSGLTLSVVCAVVAIAFWSRSPVLVIASWFPLVWRCARIFVNSDIGLYRWATVNAFVGGGAVVLASIVTGGLSSPVLTFIIVVGLVTSMAFTHQPLWAIYPGAMVLTVAAFDIADGGLEGVDLLVASSVSIVALAVPRLVSDMVTVELSYRKKAVLDPLTGCLNRTSMHIRINELQHQASQSGDDIGVIAIDIDRFKSINDEHGHATGDEILQQVAYTIRRNLRRFELLYRTGGEEFVLLLPGAAPDVSYQLGEKIRQAVEDEIYPVGVITISVGVAPEDLEALIERADQSLLEAKNSGRNRTVQAGALG